METTNNRAKRECQRLKSHQAGIMVRPQNNQNRNQNQDEMDFLPLVSVDVNVEISDSIALISMKQEYENPIRDEPQDAADEPKGKPIDITFKFPKQKDVVISKMSVTVDDKTIEAKIEAEDKANQKFDDAIAGGHTAAMVSDARENVDLHQLDIGNILPGQKATINLQMITALKVTQGSFEFVLPMSYFPKLKKQPKKDGEAAESEPQIVFNFSAKLRSGNSFRQICHPKTFNVTEASPFEVLIQKLNADFFEVKKDIQILFNTVSADNSRYVFQRNVKQHPGKVAVMAQFLPSFNE